MNRMLNVRFSELAAVRPSHHPNQIKSAEDLVMGEEYLRVNLEGYAGRFTFLGCAPDEPGWIEVNRNGWMEILSLADAGIEPYEEGWNRDNYVISAEEDQAFLTN